MFDFKDSRLEIKTVKSEAGVKQSIDYKKNIGE